MSNPDADRDDAPFVGVTVAHSPTELQAAQVPTARIVLVGETMWLLALVITLIVPAWHTGERSWWPWACVAGFVLGGLGYAYVARGRGNAAEA